MVHGSIAIPGKTDRDEVVITTDEIAASGLDYLALGHWHSTQSGKAGAVDLRLRRARPRRSPSTRIGAGKVLLVELDERAGERTVTVDERQVGRTRFEKLEIDAATVASQPALVDAARGPRRSRTSCSTSGWSASAATSSTSTSTRSRTRSRGSFLKVRVRDASVPALTEGPLPVAGHDRRARSSATSRHASPSSRRPGSTRDEAAEQRDALRLGRLLLAGHEVSL